MVIPIFESAIGDLGGGGRSRGYCQSQNKDMRTSHLHKILAQNNACCLKRKEDRRSDPLFLDNLRSLFHHGAHLAIPISKLQLDQVTAGLQVGNIHSKLCCIRSLLQYGATGHVQHIHLLDRPLR